MEDMRPEDVVGEYREHTLIYGDGRRRKVLVTDVETPYPEGRLIVSITDLQGILVYVNQALVEVSGYRREELIGQPHHILWHPDMPRIVFQEMWTALRAGQTWRGYVKNLRKDGGYYLAYATVMPNFRGEQILSYTSVQRKPSRQKMEAALQRYAQLRAEEAGV